MNKLLLESAFFSILITVGCVFFVAGLFQYFFPPRKINWLYGYRTAASMRSIERWKFAQRFSAIAIIRTGIVLAVVAVAGLFYSISETVDAAAAVIVLILAIALLFMRVEKAIKNGFPE